MLLIFAFFAVRRMSEESHSIPSKVDTYIEKALIRESTFAGECKSGILTITIPGGAKEVLGIDYKLPWSGKDK